MNFLSPKKISFSNSETRRKCSSWIQNIERAREKNDKNKIISNHWNFFTAIRLFATLCTRLQFSHGNSATLLSERKPWKCYFYLDFGWLLFAAAKNFISHCICTAQLSELSGFWAAATTTTTKWKRSIAQNSYFIDSEWWVVRCFFMLTLMTFTAAAWGKMMWRILVIFCRDLIFKSTESLTPKTVGISLQGNISLQQKPQKSHHENQKNLRLIMLM